MAVAWSWAFGNENTAALTAMGFSFVNTTGTPDSSNVYTYTGSPTRWSLGIGRTTSGQTTINFPTTVGSTVNQGWLSVPLRLAPGYLFIGSASRILRVVGGAYATEIRTANVSGATCNLSLWVGNTFKETPLVTFNFSSWKYIALKFDVSGTTHYGQIWVDGVAISDYRSQGSLTAASSVTLSIQSPSSSGAFGAPTGTLIGQVILYDDLADAGQTSRFVTRIEPNTDGTDVGTWTPTGAATDWQAVDSPFDAATYTEDAAAVSGDRMEVLTSGGGSDLATALGTTPTVIGAVTHHNYSSGATVSAKAIVGDGTSETSGGSSVIGTTTTYLYVNAPIRPSGGAWTGTDAPTLVYEVV